MGLLLLIMHSSHVNHTNSFPLLKVLSIPDNDQLSAHLSTAMGADLLILLSDVEGIYTGHPTDPASRLIRTYYPEHENNVKFWGKSRVGKGGMESKVRAGADLKIGLSVVVFLNGWGCVFQVRNSLQTF